MLKNVQPMPAPDELQALRERQAAKAMERNWRKGLEFFA